jgi:hypothetical protein
MTIAKVKCVQDKYDFQVVGNFSQLTENLDSLECSEQILGELRDIFKIAKDIIVPKNDLRNIECLESTSHSKILYFEKETKHGKFKIEGMCFSGDCYTCLHTHPEYVVDEVIKGQLSERSYQLDDQEEATFEIEHKRSEGSFQSSFDIEGNPHTVSGLEGPCTLLSLSLGHNCVESFSTPN